MDIKMDNKNTLNLENIDKRPNGENLTINFRNNSRLLSRNRDTQQIDLKVIKAKNWQNSSSCDSGYVIGLPLNKSDNDIIKNELKHRECKMAWIAVTKNDGENQPWVDTKGNQTG
jgi:hypothetical protein